MCDGLVSHPGRGKGSSNTLLQVTSRWVSCDGLESYTRRVGGVVILWVTSSLMSCDRQASHPGGGEGVQLFPNALCIRHLNEHQPRGWPVAQMPLSLMALCTKMHETEGDFFAIPWAFKWLRKTNNGRGLLTGWHSIAYYISATELFTF